MIEDQAQLSSLASTLEELTRRVVQTADRHRGTPRDDVAQDLYEVERSLRNASQRLAKAIKGLR